MLFSICFQDYLKIGFVIKTNKNRMQWKKNVKDFCKTMYLLLVFVMSINYFTQCFLLVILSVHTG